MECCIIDIEVKKRSKLKELIHKIISKVEDIIFSLVLKLPEQIIPHSVLNWMDRYTIKRINQLKGEQIKQAWTNMYLQEAVDQINKQSKKEAPTEET